MPRYPTTTLRRNAVWNVGGNLVYALCQWLIISLLAKWGSPILVGQYALGLAISAPVILLTSLQLAPLLATDARQSYRFRTYLTLRLIGCGVALLAIAVISAFMGESWKLVAVVNFIGLAKAIDSVSEICYSRLQQVEKLPEVARGWMLNGIVSMLLLAAAVRLTHSVVVAAAASTTGSLLALLLVAAPCAASTFRSGSAESPGLRAALRWSTANVTRRLVESREPGTLLSLALYTAPMGVVSLLISLNGNIPVYAVHMRLGDHAVGIFTGIGYGMTAAAVVNNALGQAAAPLLSRLWKDGERQGFYRLVFQLCALGGGVGFAGLILAGYAGHAILTRLYTPPYAPYAHSLCWIMVAAALWNVTSMLGYGATASRRLKFQPAALTAVCLASLLACSKLVPRYGVTGAAAAIAVSAGVGMVAYLMVLLLSPPGDAARPGAGGEL